MGLYRGVTSPFAVFPRYHSAPAVVRAVSHFPTGRGSPRVKLLNGERTNVAR